MPDVQTLEAIRRNRMQEWIAKLRAVNATPLVLLAVGHGDHAGEIYMLVPENMPHKDIEALLSAAYFRLVSGEEPARISREMAGEERGES